MRPSSLAALIHDDRQDLVVTVRSWLAHAVREYLRGHDHTDASRAVVLASEMQRVSNTKKRTRVIFFSDSSVTRLLTLTTSSSGINSLALQP